MTDLPATKPVVLIVEDEAQIRKFLRVTLNAHGFSAIEAASVRDGLYSVVAQRPEVILLDLGLPDRDGQDFIRDVRQGAQTPIIVVSARGQEADKIEALENGADDYLTKPFATGELLARIRVALRHARRREGDNPVYSQGGLTVDLITRQVTLDGVHIHLTPIEYKLLSVLARQAGKVLTHAQLVKEVWGRHNAGQNPYLRIHTQHLREKLKDDPMQPRFIMTEAGIGYRLKS